MSFLVKEIEELHTWFDQNRRSFPWREKRTPYRVWVSEVMLQQTRASVVVPYFLRWVEQLPDVRTLAKAPLEKVIKLWEGLGYYSRARNLHAGAKEIVVRFRGEIPSSAEELSSIPGLGVYTVGAILSFGFGKKAAAVDGNVLRVLSRYFAIVENVCKTAVARSIRARALEVLDEKEPWVTAEALIELGATVCIRAPLCEQCPLRSGCKGHQRGIAASLPIKNRGAALLERFRIVAIVECEKKFLIRKETEGRVMADLYEFPYFEGDGDTPFGIVEKQVLEQLGLRTKYIQAFEEVRHTFTKYKAHLFPFLLHALCIEAVPGWTWVSADTIKELPFSAGHRRIVERLCL